MKLISDMAEDWDIVTGIIVALSKIQHLAKRDCGIFSDSVKDLKELEKALRILEGICEDQEEGDAREWRKRIRKLRKDVEKAAQGFQGTIREYSNLLGDDLLDIMGRRLPEGEYKERIEKELGKVLGGTKKPVFKDRYLQAGSSDSKVVSELERKLERVDTELSQGLDRYFVRKRRDTKKHD